MRVLKRIVLRPKGRIPENSLPSHSLARAIISSMYILFGEKLEFTITDLLPIAWDKVNLVDISLLPKPLFVAPSELKVNTDNAKSFNKCVYITPKAFDVFYVEIESFLAFKNITTKLRITNQIMHLHHEVPLLDLKVNDQAHNTIARGTVGSSSVGYFHSQAYISGNAFYVLIDSNNFNKVVASLRYLADRGLGFMNSIGVGAWEISSVDEVELSELIDTEPSLLLSSYVPEQNTEADLIFYHISLFQPIDTQGSGTKLLAAQRYIKSGATVKTLNPKIGTETLMTEHNIFPGYAIVYQGGLE